MRFVCGCIPIGFKQSDLFRMLFERNGVQRQDARFNTNRSLDFFFKSEFVGVKLRWINLQFCYPHNRASDCVLAIVAGILVSRHLNTADDLFGGPEGSLYLFESRLS
jgi:hypothetical protein